MKPNILTIECVALSLLFVIVAQWTLRRSINNQEPPTIKDPILIPLEGDVRTHTEKLRDWMLDTLRDAEFSLWSALITVNGIIVTVFSIFGISQTRLSVSVTFLSLSIVLFALLSLYLMISNYFERLEWLAWSFSMTLRLLAGEAVSKSQYENQDKDGAQLLVYLRHNTSNTVKLFYIESVFLLAVYIFSVVP